jgi:endonuclease YncB( thermonuclease family)
MTARQKTLLGLILASLSLAAFAILASPSHSGEESDRQHVTVIDGDTLKVNGRLVHLYGIDCPELGQDCVHNGHKWHCGLSAMLHLDKIITLNRGRLDCTPWGKEEGNAAKGEKSFVCRVGQEDLADTLLRDGYCVTVAGAFPDYGEAERSAKEAHFGIWGSKFVPPSEWRQGKRLPDVTD